MSNSEYEISDKQIDVEILLWDKKVELFENRIKKHLELADNVNDVFTVDDGKRLELFSLLDRLLSNESKHLPNALLYEKIKDTYQEFRVVGANCCGGCAELDGDGWCPIGQVETVGVPPYHPNCGCSIEFRRVNSKK